MPAVREIAVDTPMGRSMLKKENQESAPISAPTKYGDHRFIRK
jgi:transcription elongation GreA/GreB family factor